MTKIKNVIKSITKKEVISESEEMVKTLLDIKYKKGNGFLNEIPKRLWLNPSFCYEVLDRTIHAFKYIDESIFKNHIDYLDDFLLNNKFSELKKLLTVEIKEKYIYSNKKYMLSYIEENPLNIELASIDLKLDKDIVLKATEYIYKEDIIKIIPETLLKDEEFLIKVVEGNSNLLSNKMITQNISDDIIVNKWNDLNKRTKEILFEKLNKLIITEDLIEQYVNEFKWNNLFETFPELENRSFSTSFLKKYARLNYRDLPEK